MNNKDILERLVSDDDLERDCALIDLEDLISKGEFTRKDAIRYLELLESSDEFTRARAWQLVPRFLKSGLLTVEEVRERIQYYLELLESDLKEMIDDETFDSVRDTAWSALTDLIDRGVITREDSRFFLKLLESQDADLRRRIWLDIKVFLNKGIIMPEEARRRKRFFFELLKCEDYFRRMVAWGSVGILIDKGVITREDSAFFLELLKSGNKNIRSNAKDVKESLIKIGVIIRDDPSGAD